jgi:uncharacterized protein DUF3883
LHRFQVVAELVVEVAPHAIGINRLASLDSPNAIIGVRGGDGPKESSKTWLSRKGRKIVFALRDALNRQLAMPGEEFVVRLERHGLLLAGGDDVAREVLWVAVEIGDGLVFDVLTFDDQNELEKLIEVKTTGVGRFFPFYVNSNEVRCSEDMAEKYQLFWVVDLARTPRLYILTGSSKANCCLEPTP